MMKSPRAWTVAVRDPKGVIHVKRERLRELPGIFRLPLVRGVLILFHTLVLGIMALEYSASMAHDEEQGEEPLSKTAIAATIGVAILLGIGLFILIPLWAAKLVGLLISGVAESSLLFNLVDGLVRVVIFLLYVYLIGLWGEIARVFQYHGAEHKALHALEDGVALDVASIRGYSPQHPRCGTSFLMIVMVVAMLVFSAIPQSWPFLYKALARIVLIPFIAGLSYETLKFSARHQRNPFMRILIAPGLWLQALTTREPDDAQIEVAIMALNEVLILEKEQRSGAG